MHLDPIELLPEDALFSDHVHIQPERDFQLEIARGDGIDVDG